MRKEPPPRRRKVRGSLFPPSGENSARSLAPPLPTSPASLGCRGSPICAKSAVLRFRLPAKTPPAPLLLLFPRHPLRWAAVGALFAQSPRFSVSAFRRKLRPLPCSSSSHVTHFAGLPREPYLCKVRFPRDALPGWAPLVSLPCSSSSHATRFAELPRELRCGPLCPA